jgi:methionine aminotransferase
VVAPRLPSRLPQVGTTIFTVMSRLAVTHGAINLSQGFPDFAPPAPLLDRLTFHLHHGANQYPPMAGVPVLRAAIAEKVQRLYGASYDAETDVTVTAGATEALFCALACCVRPGDEVILFAPAYDSYSVAVELNGGVVRHAHLRAPEFRPDWDEVKGLISPRTRAVVINSPHNPTGAVWPEDDLRALAALLDGTDILVVSDEVYEHMVYVEAPQGARHASAAQFDGLRERSFVISSFGKTYHITGWKVAYCLAPPALNAELRKVHQFVTFTVHHPSQCALADFMSMHPEFADGLSAFYAAKRDFFRRALAGSRFELLPCHGTYFQLARYAAISDEPDVEFARRLTTEFGVAAIPVSVFSPPGALDDRLVRFCFAKEETTLAQAAVRLCAI